MFILDHSEYKLHSVYRDATYLISTMHVTGYIRFFEKDDQTRTFSGVAMEASECIRGGLDLSDFLSELNV